MKKKGKSALKRKCVLVEETRGRSVEGGIQGEKKVQVREDLKSEARI